jgi:hypothetical protein
MVKDTKKRRGPKKRVGQRVGTSGGLSKEVKPEPTLQATFAQVMVKGVGPNATAAVGYSKMLGKLDLMECVRALAEQTRKVQRGDLAVLESMLAAQAVALNAMFTQLAFEASKMNIVDHIDRFTRLAFKAQSQCRATVETLALIKNPPVVIAQQANVAHGPQQVNNAVVSESGRSVLRARARNSDSGQNELLETDRERLDSGAPGATVERHQALAPVGTVNGPAHK